MLLLPRQCSSCTWRLWMSSVSCWMFFSCASIIFSLTASSLTICGCCLRRVASGLASASPICCFHSNCDDMMSTSRRKTSTIGLEFITAVSSQRPKSHSAAANSRAKEMGNLTRTGSAHGSRPAWPSQHENRPGGSGDDLARI